MIPAARQAARNPNRITNKRPISAIKLFSSYELYPQGASPLCPHPEERALARVSKDEESLASWFETALARLLTMRNTSIRHRHGAKRLPFARRQFLGLRFQLAASGQDVAATRRAHRRGIAGVENIFRELFDLIPVRTLVARARPRVERNEIDLGRNALQQLDQQLGVVERIVDALEHHIFERDAPRIGGAWIISAGLQQF